MSDSKDIKTAAMDLFKAVRLPLIMFAAGYLTSMYVARRKRIGS